MALKTNYASYRLSHMKLLIFDCKAMPIASTNALNVVKTPLIDTPIVLNNNSIKAKYNINFSIAYKNPCVTFSICVFDITRLSIFKQIFITQIPITKMAKNLTIFHILPTKNALIVFQIIDQLMSSSVSHLILYFKAILKTSIFYKKLI